jgi:hypothetical protein
MRLNWMCWVFLALTVMGSALSPGPEEKAMINAKKLSSK